MKICIANLQKLCDSCMRAQGMSPESDPLDGPLLVNSKRLCCPNPRSGKELAERYNAPAAGSV